MNIEKINRKRERLELEFKLKLDLVFRKQFAEFERAVDRNPKGAVKNIDKYFEKGIEPVYRQMIIKTARAFQINEKELLKAGFWENLINDFLEKNGGDRITEIIDFSRRYVIQRLRPILTEGISNGEGISVISRKIIKEIGEYKGRFATYRAERIARTEIVGTSNWASINSAKATGLGKKLKKKWLASVDGRERDTHREMNSKRAIEMDEFFEVRRVDGGFDKMQYPGDPRGSAGNVINCRCAIIYERA